MNTFEFSVDFIPSLGSDHLGSYVIPWSHDGNHDEARLNAVLSAHGPGLTTTWDACDEGQLVGLYGDGPLGPCARFGYTDADVLIWESEVALNEACPPETITIEKLEQRKRQGLA